MGVTPNSPFEVAKVSVRREDFASPAPGEGVDDAVVDDAAAGDDSPAGGDVDTAGAGLV